MKLVCTSGEVEAGIGDRFTDKGRQWEIIGFRGAPTYSPSSIGGTPVVISRCLGEMPSWYREYANEDGTLDFCGDSVAAMMLRGAIVGRAIG